MLPSAVNTMAEAVESGASGSKDNGCRAPPTPKSSLNKSGVPLLASPDRPPLEMDTRLPPGWYRKVSKRLLGSSAGSYDVYIFNPEGKKFRSCAEVERFVAEKGLESDLDCYVFDFSSFGTNNLTLRARREAQATPKKSVKKKPAVSKASHKLIKQKITAVKKKAAVVKKKAIMKKAPVKTVAQKLVVKMDFLSRKRSANEDAESEIESSDEEKAAKEATASKKTVSNKKRKVDVKSSPAPEKTTVDKSASQRKTPKKETASSSSDNTAVVNGNAKGDDIENTQNVDTMDSAIHGGDDHNEQNNNDESEQEAASPRKRAGSKTRKDSSTPLKEVINATDRHPGTPLSPSGRRDRRSTSRDSLTAQSPRGKSAPGLVTNNGVLFHTPTKLKRSRLSKDSDRSGDEDMLMESPGDLSHGQVDGAAADTPPRRGRGRPRKDAVELVTPSKAGRGRPRKFPLDSPKQVVEAMETETPAKELARSRRGVDKEQTGEGSAASGDNVSPTKKTRGRPKSQIQPVESDAESVNPQENAEPVVKKKRGRPRKSLPGSVEDSNEVNLEKKQDSTEGNKGEIGEDSPVKRGRGRPRKFPRTPEQTGTNVSAIGEKSVGFPLKTPVQKSSLKESTKEEDSAGESSTKKTPVVASKAKVSDEPDDSITESPVRRSRGRPRKIPVVEFSEKRPRGRPQREVVESREESNVIVTTAEIHREQSDDDDELPTLTYEGTQDSPPRETNLHKEPPLLVLSSNITAFEDESIEPDPELPVLVSMSPRKSARKPKPYFHKDFVSPTRKLISSYEQGRASGKKPKEDQTVKVVSTPKRGRPRKVSEPAPEQEQPVKTPKRASKLNEQTNDLEGVASKSGNSTPISASRKNIRNKHGDASDSREEENEYVNKVKKVVLPTGSNLSGIKPQAVGRVKEKVKGVQSMSAGGLKKIALCASKSSVAGFGGDSVKGNTTQKAEAMEVVSIVGVESVKGPVLTNSDEPPELMPVDSVSTVEEPVPDEYVREMDPADRAALSAMLLDHAYTNSLTYTLPPEVVEEQAPPVLEQLEAAAPQDVMEAVSLGGETEISNQQDTVASATFVEEPLKELPEVAMIFAPVAEEPKAATPNMPVAEEPKEATPSAPVAEEPKAATPSVPAAEEPNVTTPSAPSAEEPNVTTPSAPSAEEPDVTTPSVPSAEEPNVTTPSAPSAEEPDVTTPSAPAAEEPDVATPSVPSAEEPDVTTPSAPAAEEPDVATPSVPAAEEPNVTTPSVPAAEEPDVATPSVPSAEEPSMATPSALVAEEPKAATPNVSAAEEPNVVTPSALSAEEPNMPVLMAHVAEEPMAATTIAPVAEEPNVATLSVMVAEEPKETTATATVAEESKEATTVAPVAEEPPVATTSALEAEEPTVAMTIAPVAEEPTGATASALVAEEPTGTTTIAPIAEEPTLATTSASVAEEPTVATTSALVAEEPMVVTLSAPVAEVPKVVMISVPVAVTTAASADSPLFERFQSFTPVSTVVAKPKPVVATSPVAKNLKAIVANSAVAGRLKAMTAVTTDKSKSVTTTLQVAEKLKAVDVVPVEPSQVKEKTVAESKPLTKVKVTAEVDVMVGNKSPEATLTKVKAGVKRKANADALPTPAKHTKLQDKPIPGLSVGLVSKAPSVKSVKLKAKQGIVSEKMSPAKLGLSPGTLPRDMATSVAGLVKPMGIKGTVIVKKNPKIVPGKKGLTSPKTVETTTLAKLEKSLKGIKGKEKTVRVTPKKISHKGGDKMSPIKSKKGKLNLNESERAALLKQKKGLKGEVQRKKGLHSSPGAEKSGNIKAKKHALHVKHGEVVTIGLDKKAARFNKNISPDKHKKRRVGFQDGVKKSPDMIKKGVRHLKDGHQATPDKLKKSGKAGDKHKKVSGSHKDSDRVHIKKSPHGLKDGERKTPDKHKKVTLSLKDSDKSHTEKPLKGILSVKDSEKSSVDKPLKGILTVKESEKTPSDKPLKGILSVKSSEKSGQLKPKRLSLTINTGEPESSATKSSESDQTLTSDSTDNTVKTPEKSCLTKNDHAETKSPNGTRRVSIGAVEINEIDQTKSPGPPSTSFDLASLAFAPPTPKLNKRRKSSESKSPKVKKVGGTWSFTPLSKMPPVSPKSPTAETPASASTSPKETASTSGTGPKSILKKS